MEQNVLSLIHMRIECCIYRRCSTRQSPSLPFLPSAWETNVQCSTQAQTSFSFLYVSLGVLFFQFHFVSGHHQKRDRTASVLSYSMGLRCMCYWYKEKKVVLALAPSFWVSFFLPGLSDWRNVERVYYYYRLLPFPFVSYIASFTLLFHVERAHKLTTLLSSMCSGK